MHKQRILIPVVIILLLFGTYFYFFRSNVINYTIEASAESGGRIEPAGDVSVTDGESLSFNVFPDEGYHIFDVLVDGVSVGSVNSYEFTDISANHVIEASFELNEYTLTVTGAEGIVSLDPDKPSYHFGDVVMLTATPNAGWVFSGWSGDLSSSSNPDSITLDEDKAVTALFTRMSWTIEASAGPGGCIDPSGNLSVDEGSDQSFTITPDVGYHISDVLVEGVSVGSVDKYNFTIVSADHTIVAMFEADAEVTWAIMASAGPGGSIAPEGDVVVMDGGNPSFTVTPNTGHHILDLLVDNVSLGPMDHYEFTGVNSNHTIRAVFDKVVTSFGYLSRIWSYLGEIYDIEVSDDGEYLAASSEFVLNYYRTDDPEPIWTAINRYEAIFWDVAVSRHGDYVVVGDETGRINFYSEASTKTGYISSAWSGSSMGIGIKRETLDISKSGDVVAVAGRDGLIHVYKDSTVKTGINLDADWVVGTSATDYVKILLSSDGKYLVSCGSILIGDSSQIIVSYLDLETEDILWSWVSPFPAIAYDLETSNDGDMVTLTLTDTSSTRTGVYCWMDASDLTGTLGSLPSWMHTENIDSPSSVAMSLNGESIAEGTLDDDTLSFWKDAQGSGGETLAPDWSKPSSVQDVSLSDDGQLVVVSALQDQHWQLMVYLYDGSLVDSVQVASQITSLATSSDCCLIAVAQGYSKFEVYRYEPI